MSKFDLSKLKATKTTTALENTKGLLERRSSLFFAKEGLARKRSHNLQHPPPSDEMPRCAPAPSHNINAHTSLLSLFSSKDMAVQNF